MEIWDKREANNKFTVVCIVHHSEVNYAQRTSINADNFVGLRLAGHHHGMGKKRFHTASSDFRTVNPIPIRTPLLTSRSVARAFRHKFLTLADSIDPAINSAGYENIPVDVHVPILNLTYGNILPHPIASNSKLSSAVIQGSFNADRRDYSRIFQDLSTSLESMFRPEAATLYLIVLKGIQRHGDTFP